MDEEIVVTEPGVSGVSFLLFELLELSLRLVSILGRVQRLSPDIFETNRRWLKACDRFVFWIRGMFEKTEVTMGRVVVGDSDKRTTGCGSRMNMKMEQEAI